MFIANLTKEFILGLDILHAHDASVVFWCHMLWLRNE
jgi:hypothetical protein